MDSRILENLIKNLQDKKKQKPWYVWIISLLIIILYFIASFYTPHTNLIYNQPKENELQKTIKILVIMTFFAILITILILKS